LSIPESNISETDMGWYCCYLPSLERFRYWHPGAGGYSTFGITSGKQLSATGDSHRPFLAVAETGAATGELRD
jgi:hypothetical protein